MVLIIFCFSNKTSVTNLSKDLILYNKVFMDHDLSLCCRKGTNMIIFCLIVFSILNKWFLDIFYPGAGVKLMIFTKGTFILITYLIL